jgi:DNA-binding transcriptional MerR regulator
MSKNQKRQKALAFEVPTIPNKIYFTIGEASKLSDLKPHVLRYWETEFTMLTPVKRKGNRRYYTKKDIELILEIKTLLYQDGFTIEGARTALKKKNKKSVQQPVMASEPVQQKDPAIAETVANLKNILNLIEEDVT